METFFTLYAVNVLRLSQGEGATMLTAFSLTFVAFAIPAGLLGSKLGRKRTILIGLTGITLAFIPVLFMENKLIIMILLAVGGIFWACININSLPMVVELASKDKVGSFTGYYYFFSFSAAILAPITFGAIRDLTDNYSLLFVFSSVAFILALISMLFVKHGEADTETK
ncbi:MAG: MFS transporter [Bacillota bacterium]|nr:MFS transporter [Bacillota bacterium]